MARTCPIMLTMIIKLQEIDYTNSLPDLTEI